MSAAQVRPLDRQAAPAPGFVVLGFGPSAATRMSDAATIDLDRHYKEVQPHKALSAIIYTASSGS
jgi:hypothetical protein